MKRIVKCKDCGASLEVSRDGWITDSVARKDGKVILPVKREVKYTEWIHVPGHFRGKKQCPGSGASPAGL